MEVKALQMLADAARQVANDAVNAWKKAMGQKWVYRRPKRHIYRRPTNDAKGEH